ncbi:MAG TPA: hypothetical protein DHW16_01110 [Ruminococcaceae bacterium]|jgi:hypothetical protein|nr:MAG: hypothetical protein BHV88_03915 [Clostridiales bacterium 41_12_two_minus]HCK42994.1 hypothetical protein [Oscillospiraceae bacterium]
MDFDFDKFDDNKKVDDLEPPVDYRKDEKEKEPPEEEKKDDKKKKRKKSTKFSASDDGTKTFSSNQRGEYASYPKSDDGTKTVTLSFKVKKLNKKQIIAIVIAVVFVVFVAIPGIYCAVHQESPADMIVDMFTSNEKQIIGKWQTEDDKGMATGAYEFYDDGTYKSYNALAGNDYALEGDYTLKGSKLILKGFKTAVYKYSINGQNLSLTLLTIDDVKQSDQDKFVYKSVEHINVPTLIDALSNAASRPATGYLTNNGDNVPMGGDISSIRNYYAAIDNNKQDDADKLTKDSDVVFADEKTEVSIEDDQTSTDYTQITVNSGKYKGNKYFVKNSCVNKNE